MHANTAGVQAPSAEGTLKYSMDLTRQTLRKLNSFWGQECSDCIQPPQIANEGIPAQQLVGCNNSYCVRDISSVPCMDDPANGCVCNSTSNSCGVMSVDAAVQLGRIPMKQSDSGRRDAWVAIFNMLPRQVLQYVNKALYETEGDTGIPMTNQFDLLPAAFGCPDWPPLQQSWSSNEGQKDLQSFVGLDVPDLPSVSCWVDARVAVNLLTMAAAQKSRPCVSTQPEQECVKATTKLSLHRD